MNTKATAQHTPSPWEKDRRGILIGSNGESVYVWDAGIGLANRTPVTEGNAAFIVRACNAHDELVAALRKMLETSRQIRNGQVSNAKAAAEEMARAVLAKAGAL